MNQTQKKSADQKKREDVQGAQLLNPDHYIEEPRPNLFNVIKKIRESKQAFKRVLYIAKLNEAEIKGELEKEFTNYFKGIAEDKEFTGLHVILGSYCVHFIEGDIPVINQILHTLNEFACLPNSIYSNIWIIHQVEECPEKAFSAWMCKNVVIGGSSREIKNNSQYERSWIIYESFLDIGKQVSQVMGKGASQINQTIKNMASELIPTGEELQSATGETEMTLSEYLQFIGEPPDILLEKELQWPVEPDLIY